MNWKKEIPVDNSMVVPYNPFLLKKYRCHINVEYCASIKNLKYIFHYIYKGNDRAYRITKTNASKNTNKNEVNHGIYDELRTFIDEKYLSPMKAARRLEAFALTICGRSHGVIVLRVL